MIELARQMIGLMSARLVDEAQKLGGEQDKDSAWFSHSFRFGRRIVVVILGDRCSWRFRCAGGGKVPVNGFVDGRDFGTVSEALADALKHAERLARSWSQDRDEIKELLDEVSQVR